MIAEFFFSYGSGVILPEGEILLIAGLSTECYD